MSAPLPQEYYKHLQQLRRPARRRTEVPWIQILLFLAVIGGGGWAYYHYVWLLRLPQERTIKDRQGNVITARLEGHDPDFLKYTLLSDLSVHYIAIDQLAPADQDFVRSTNGAIEWKFPLEYDLLLDGKEVPVRIEARDDNWVKYTLMSDRSMHYAPINTLSLPNQDLIRHLAPTLSMGYPLEYTLTDAQGKKLNVSLLGHDEDLVEYITMDDNIKHYDLITTLSPVDQSLVRQMAPDLVLDYPVEHALTTLQGKILPGRIEGRTAEVVKMVDTTSGAIRYYLINDLSAPDQKFILAFPANLSLSYPLVANMADKDGKDLRVRISARSANLVRLSLPGETDDLYPLTMFSSDDQKIIRSLTVSLTTQYPMDYILTGPDNQPVNRQLLGRSSTYVKINTLDGKVYAYPINKLSALNQSVLKFLPENIDSMEVEPSKLAGYYNIKADNSSAIVDLEKRMATTVRQDDEFQGRMPGTTGSNTIDPRQEQLDASRRDLEISYKKLLSVTSKEALAGEPASVHKARDSITTLIQNIDYIEEHKNDQFVSTSDRLAHQKEESTDLQQMEGHIKEILSSAGLNML